MSDDPRLLEFVAQKRYIQHPEPVWREKANWIDNVIADDDEKPVIEQLWFRREGFGLVLCCLPFYVYGIALGDTLTIDESYRASVLASAGRKLFRVYILRPEYTVAEIARELDKVHALHEVRSNRYLAIDAEDGQMAWDISGYLEGLRLDRIAEWEPAVDWPVRKG